jgi:hypothetical protein
MKREEFVHCLQSVTPSLLSGSKTLEQADCLIFRKGEVCTYNDEMCCRCPMPNGFDDKFSGAVPAKKLLEQLGKWTDKDIEIVAENGRLNISSGKRKTWLRTSKDIRLPIHQVERPETYTRLPIGYTEAVSTVGSCAGTDKNDWHLMCVHIHPDRIEASNRRQICRWKLTTKLKKPILVKQYAIANLSSAAPDRFAETKHWMHFFNKESGLVMSCRRYADDQVKKYPDLDVPLEIHKGRTVSLEFVPPEEVERAAVFSKENDRDFITVEIDDAGKARISSEGVSGGYRGKSFSFKGWKGKAASFRISPAVLINLVKLHPEATIGCSRAAKESRGQPNRLKAVTPTYEYITSLAPVKA